MFKVTGMTCSHCAGTVNKAVQAAAPKGQVTIDLKQGTVNVTGPHDAKAVIAAVEAAGYHAEQLPA